MSNSLSLDDLLSLACFRMNKTATGASQYLGSAHLCIPNAERFQKTCWTFLRRSTIPQLTICAIARAASGEGLYGAFVQETLVSMAFRASSLSLGKGVMVDIIAIHSYLVYPDKGVEEPRPMRGTAVTFGEGPFDMLQQIFADAPRECQYNISFSPAEDGTQQNDCRDLFLAYLQEPSLEAGQVVAERLQGVTTKRSGLGLLFLIVGARGNRYRLVVSRFPASPGILAEEDSGSLSVQFIERVFMKSEKAYKSAMYEGFSLDEDFWVGRAVDKQINSEITISNYWIRDFLLSDFATTGERGTRRLANALRAAVNKTSDLEIKEEIAAAVRLTQGLEGQVTSASDFTSRFRLSEKATQAVKEQMREKLFVEQFRFLPEEFHRHVAFRSIELDNGARLTADADTFEQVFARSESDTGEVKFSTSGKIVDERFRKRK